MNRARLRLTAALTLLAALVQLLFLYLPWAEQLEVTALRSRFEARGRITAPSEVLVIGIDEASYEELGVPLTEGWPRSIHVRLLRKLKAAGVRRVLFDVLFVGPGSDPGTDSDLAEAFSLSPTVIGAQRIESETEVLGIPAKQVELIEPLPAFAERAEVALVGLPMDDGIVGRFALSRGGRPSLAQAAVPSAPALPGDEDFIKFYGPASSIPTLSYYQVLEETFPLELLKDKIIFVGAIQETGIGQEGKDTFHTTIGSSMSGVQIHATAALNLLHQDWIRRPGSSRESWASVFLAALFAAPLTLVSPSIGLALLLLGLFGWLAGSYLAFLSGLHVAGASVFVIVLPLVFLSFTLASYVRTRRAHLQTERAFRHYLSPVMARKVAEDPNALFLGGHVIEATALFSDIESFTTTAERMPPEQVASMLNEYFTELMAVVFKHEGTLIKFIGDAAFVIWGAPLPQPDHPSRAVLAALEIREALRGFNGNGRFPELRTRLGIHTGPMLIGNLGSKERFDYTAIGDSVNLASRLEGLNKYFGTSILMSEETVSRMDAEKAGISNVLPLSKVVVKGKLEPVQVFTILDTAAREQWILGLKSLYECRFGEAAKAFEEAASLDPKLSVAARFYREAIEKYGSDPSWRGELRAGEK